MVALVFLYTLIDNVKERPDGLIIGGVFILTILVISAVSRYRRATELRVTSTTFADAESETLWALMKGKKVNLAPVRELTREGCNRKAAEIRQYYKVTGPLGFVHVTLLDNRSEFSSPLVIRVTAEGEDFIIEVSGANALANTIAYLSELLDPLSIFLGLTRRNLMDQAFRFLTFGEGETGLLVYTILLKHWDATPEDDVRPLIFIMSE